MLLSVVPKGVLLGETNVVTSVEPPTDVLVGIGAISGGEVVVAVPRGKGGAIQLSLGILGDVMNRVEFSHAAKTSVIQDGTDMNGVVLEFSIDGELVIDDPS